MVNTYAKIDGKIVRFEYVEACEIDPGGDLTIYMASGKIFRSPAHDDAQNFVNAWTFWLGALARNLNYP